MVHEVAPSERSTPLARVKGKNTRPELIVRSIVHALGYRFRLHGKDLPGKPDLVFPARRKVIFVNGCFWHQHACPTCKLARMPKSRPEYWKPKLQGNRERDLRQQTELHHLGWRVLVVWECELRDKERLSTILRLFLDAP